MVSVQMSVPRWMGTGLVEAKELGLGSGWVLESGLESELVSVQMWLDSMSVRMSVQRWMGSRWVL